MPVQVLTVDSEDLSSVKHTAALFRPVLGPGAHSRCRVPGEHRGPVGHGPIAPDTQA